MKWTPTLTTELRRLIEAGWTYDEIAHRLGTTRSSVKSRARVCAMPRAEGQGRRTDLEARHA